MKEENKEEILDQIKSIVRKRDKLIIDIDNLEKELLSLNEKYKGLSGEYTKVECLTCGGIGYIEDPSNKEKKVVCKNPTIPFLSCNGKGFIWLKKYEPK
jgi:hypothetical protein